MSDEYIFYEYLETPPSFDTPAKDFEGVWESRCDDLEIAALLNKHTSLGFLEHWKSLVSTSSSVEETEHVGVTIWAENFPSYQATIDIEKMYCDIDVNDYPEEDIDATIASFRRIIAHLEAKSP